MDMRLVVAAVGFLLVVGACSAPGGLASASSAAETIAPSVAPSAIAPPRATAAPTASPAASSAIDLPDLEARHGAADLEGLLPLRVSDRDMAIWSMAGRDWIEFGMADRAAEFITMCETEGVDVSEFRMAIAGRRDVARDPPYFAFVFYKPVDPVANELLLWVAGGATGFKDPTWYADASVFRERPLGGKDVLVGDEAMLKQDEHQRGRPFLYETDDFLFVVITDDESWAADALEQLPA
jgi:hypothetical protein